MSVLSLSASSLTPTPQTIAGQLTSAITADQAQQATLESEISSGSVVSQPSDNPALAAEVITLNASATRAQQYVSNATAGEGWLQQGTSTLNQALSVLQTITSAVESVSGEALSGQKAAITGIATQVASGLQQLLGLANTTYGGQAIFSGTGNPNKAYDASGNYLGSTTTAPSETVAPGVTVTTGVLGPSVFGSGTTGLLTGAGNTSPSTSGNPVGVLQQIVNDLNSGNLTAVETTDLPNLQAATATVESAAASLGADYQNMQAFTAQATATQAALQTQLGTMQDVNLAQASTQLSEAQTSYQAALWATSQISQDSLVQFLS